MRSVLREAQNIALTDEARRLQTERDTIRQATEG